MSSEILFIDTYSCPHCRTELETGYGEWQGWQRCPRCGIPSLPPVPVAVDGVRRNQPRLIAAEDVLVIDDAAAGPLDDEPSPPYVASQSSHLSPARLVFRTGLIVSLGLTFIAFLDHRMMNMTIFGGLAAIFFVLLLRKPAGRRSPS